MIHPMAPLTETAPSDILIASRRSRKLAGKRVAMVTYSSYPEDPRPRRAIDALVGEGMKVDLICLGAGEGGNQKQKGSVGGVNVLRIPIKHRRGGKITYIYQYGSFIFLSTLIFALRTFQQRYDLVYVHNMPDILVISALIPKLLGARVVLDLHDPMPELMTTIFGLDKKSANVRLIRRMEKWSIARANLVVTVNLACKKIFSARSCNAEKIAVVMNAPDPKIFPFRPAVESTKVETRGDRPFVFMYHGSMVQRNGLDLAVEALGLVHRKMPNCQLRVFGRSTPFLERVMETVRAKGLQNTVQFLGSRRQEDLVSEIEGCDVGVIPNQRNLFTDINTPTRIFEYLAVGKSVIAPSTSGIQDYFNNESLIFFEAGNAEDLADKMVFAYSQHEKLADIARSGQEIYQMHTWEQERTTLLDRVSGILN